MSLVLAVLAESYSSGAGVLPIFGIFSARFSNGQY